MNASEYDRMVEEDESECGRPLNGTGHELIGGTRLSSCSKGVLTLKISNMFALTGWNRNLKLKKCIIRYAIFCEICQLCLPKLCRLELTFRK